jgi:hypothetical protein
MRFSRGNLLGMRDPMTQITLRIPATWLEKADKVADRISTKWLPVGRVDAIRACIARGFEAFEADDPTLANSGAERQKLAGKFGSSK